jgi:hypothetical protein
VRKLILALSALAIAGGLAVFAFASSNDRPRPAERTVRTAAAGRISVYPAPGVRTASPETQLSFRGAPQDALGEVEVSGSQSGDHDGKWRAHSDGQGASFLPDGNFQAGERVTVKTGLDIAGGKDGEFSITIARRAKRRPIRPQEPINKGKGAVQRYATRRDLVPPDLTVTTAKAGRAPGYVFLAPKGGRGQEGVMIADDRGRLVYFKPMPRNRIATDFRVQTYEGKSVLTWWQGGLIVGDGRGYGVIYDDRYRPVKRVRMGNGYSMDLHEFKLTPQGTALAIAYDRVHQDLRSLGGPRDAVVQEGVVQEIDIKTGLVLFEWHSIGSVGMDEGKVPLPKHDGGEYDYMHTNSVALDRNGDFIISARNTSGIYKVDRATAKIVWRLGGTKTSFKMGRGTTTAWQHDAHPQDDGTLLTFDNGASPPVHKVSRALTLRLDERAKTVKMVSARVHPRRLLSATQGNVQALPNGNLFVGYGSQRWFAEFDKRGKVVFDGHLARGNDGYRVFRLPWEGRPAERPRAVASTSGGRVTARASWNGATGVARWELLAGPSADRLERVKSAASDGFETAITAGSRQPFVAMRALDGAGNVLATSSPIRPS